MSIASDIEVIQSDPSHMVSKVMLKPDHVDGDGWVNADLLTRHQEAISQEPASPAPDDTSK